MILLLAVSAGSVVLTGCGSSDAASKKSKSKKKSRKSDSEDDGDEEADSADSKDEDNSEKEEGKSADKEKAAKETEAAAERIWTDLMKGNASFVKGGHSTGNLVSARAELTKGQKPEVIVLGCADSRVPPELIFNKNLGELFVIRAAGNIADPISLGSIEYAVEHLHSKVLVILGHENCGAVGATVANEEMPTKNLEAIVKKIAPALEDSESCPLGGKMNMSCVELNVRQSAKDVAMESPIVKKAVKDGELVIIEAVYQLGTGKVERLKE
ncbi:MAG: carbonic anhydrase [Pyrinomonadaceae bacterium]